MKILQPRFAKFLDSIDSERKDVLRATLEAATDKHSDTGYTGHDQNLTRANLAEKALLIVALFKPKLYKAITL